MAVRSPGYAPVANIISVSWGQVSGKPNTFPPSSHTHIIGDVTGLQSALDGKLSAVSWEQVTGKPATFTPAAHTHVIADVTGLQAALDSKLSSVSWSAVTGKPTTFPPSAHTHVIGDVTGLQAALDAKLGTAVTPVVTTRALNTTFQPHATKATRVSYSARTQVTNPLLIGSSIATVTLLSDAANPPTTERCRVSAESAVGLAVSIALTTVNVAPLTYLVPAGHYVRLVSTVTGTGAASIVSQVEETLG